MAVNYPQLVAVYADRLKRAEPQTYEQFIRALDAYTTELTVAVTDAPSESILVTQGRAQQARKFFKLMTELPASVQPQKPSP